MKAETFRELALAKSEKDYGLCSPPTTAEDGLNILIEHFLGKDWYVTMPLGAEQVNTEAIYEILRRYPEKESFFASIRASRKIKKS